MNKARYSTSLSFIDLLFNLVLSFVAMFLLALLLINPPKQDSTIRREAVYALVIQWQDGSYHDVDLWMTDGKDRANYKVRQTPTMSLDRDDLGPDDTESMKHFLPKNEEIMSIRAPVPGTYTAAVHAYVLRDKSPEIPVIHWALLRVATGAILYQGTTTLHEKGQERTLIRFRIKEDGDIADGDIINQYPFVNKAL